jgi:hypothetical protein
MSHVDEGELTAYADGAWAPHEPDAQRIAQHLAECANCRNRLAQAQSLSARASEILAVAAPAQLITPPFESLVTEAKPRRQWTAPPLAWAATVILALGLGWFGRGAIPSGETRSVLMDESGASMSQPQQDAVMVSPPAEVPAAAPTISPAPAPSAVAARTRNRAAIGGAAGATTDMVGQVASAPTAESVESEEAKLESSSVLVPRDQISSKAVAAPPPAPPPPSAQTGNAALAERRGEMARMAAPQEPFKVKDVSIIEHITIAEAERRGLELHLVPELEVLRIGVASGTVIIEQKLGEGKFLTITQTTANTRTGDGADAAAVYVMRDGTRIRVAGPVPRDSLRALAERIR